MNSGPFCVFLVWMGLTCVLRLSREPHKGLSTVKQSQGKLEHLQCNSVYQCTKIKITVTHLYVYCNYSLAHCQPKSTLWWYINLVITLRNIMQSFRCLIILIWW